MHFGIEDVNVDMLDKAMNEINNRFGAESPMLHELAVFSCAAMTELQKLADGIKKRNKLKIED